MQETPMAQSGGALMTDSYDGGKQVCVYCRKGNVRKWDSIPLNDRADLFNAWLASLETKEVRQ